MVGQVKDGLTRACGGVEWRCNEAGMLDAKSTRLASLTHAPCLPLLMHTG